MQTSGPTFIRSSSKRCEAIVGMPAPAVIVLVFRGHLDAELATRVTEDCDRIIASYTRIAVFNDMEDVTGYEPGWRAVMTTWGMENTARAPSVNVLFRSKLVATGVAVSNLALGGILVSYSRREPFEERMREAGVLVPPRFPKAHGS
jgi:hypothetical protein